MEWRELALCRGEDQSIFFPENDRLASGRAKAICATCPVMAQCMDYAIAHDEVGVWGGTTQRERRRIKDQYVRPSHLQDLAPRRVMLPSSVHAFPFAALDQGHR